MPKKEAWTVCRFKGSLPKKKGIVFLRGAWYPNAHYVIYKNCIKTGIYPNAWKKSNIVPVHKKGDMQIVNNYRPVSLLPIVGKVFEKILSNSIFGYLQENCLLCDSQSGFQPSDSCEYQLLSIQLLSITFYYFLSMIFMHLLIVTIYVCLSKEDVLQSRCFKAASRGNIL